MGILVGALPELCVVGSLTGNAAEVSWDTDRSRVNSLEKLIVDRSVSHSKCRRILVQECQEIPPRSQQDVTARVTLRSVRDQVKDVIVETQ